MTNRFPGACYLCGTTVPAGAGAARMMGSVRTRWVVQHITCPAQYKCSGCGAPIADPLDITHVCADADDASYDAWVARPVVPGMYMTPSGDIVKVQNAKSSGKPYAKRLAHAPGVTKPEFVYEAGLIRSLTVDMRMTLAQATAFGVATGVCCVCSAFLTDPKSVAAGIGPVCAKRV